MLEWNAVVDPGLASEPEGSSARIAHAAPDEELPEYVERTRFLQVGMVEDLAEVVLLIPEPG